MADSAKPNQERIFIYIVCVIAFLGSLPTFFFSFTELVYSIGSWYINFLYISSVLLWASVVGIWKMKKWAVLTYTVAVIVIQIVQINHEDFTLWTYSSLIIPSLVTVTVWYYFKKMS